MLQEAEKRPLPRESLDIHGVNIDDSLIMAIQNPLPDDSDDDDDALIEATMRLPTIRGVMTHPVATPRPTTKARAAVSSPNGAQSPPRSQSSIRTLFPGDSISQTAKTTSRNFSPHSPTHDVIEDAIRANAEQAESSAERLTELMEPDNSYPSTPSGVGPSAAAPPPPATSTVLKAPARPAVAPSTPVPQKGKGILSHLALFQNSPAVKGTPSVMDRLYENKAMSGWWLKRKTCEYLVSTSTLSPSSLTIHYSVGYRDASESESAVSAGRSRLLREESRRRLRDGEDVAEARSYL